jgi:hypothetical protein
MQDSRDWVLSVLRWFIASFQRNRNIYFWNRSQQPFNGSIVETKYSFFFLLRNRPPTNTYQRDNLKTRHETVIFKFTTSQRADHAAEITSRIVRSDITPSYHHDVPRWLWPVEKPAQTNPNETILVHVFFFFFLFSVSQMVNGHPVGSKKSQIWSSKLQASIVPKTVPNED